MASRTILKDDYTIFKSEKVSVALEKMKYQLDGTLVVVDEKRRPIGIVTLEDLSKVEDKNLPVEKFMIKRVLTASGKEDLLDLFVTMVRNKLNAIVICDKRGKVKEIITVSEIFRRLEGMLGKREK